MAKGKWLRDHFRVTTGNNRNNLRPSSWLASLC